MTLSLRDLWQSLEKTGPPEFLVIPTATLLRRDLAELVGRFAAAFDAAGLSAGDRVLIILADEASAVAAFVAALFDGLVPVMLSAETPAPRAAAVAASVEAKGAVTSVDRQGEDWLHAILHPILQRGASKPRGWLSRRPSATYQIAQSLALPDARRAPRLPDDPDALAYLLFTSGTTSSPSGVMVTQRNLLANVQTIGRILGVNAQSRVFNDMVLAHADGLVQGPLLALATGATLVRAGGFTVAGMEDWLNGLRRAKITHFLTVPTIWSLIDRYARHDDYFDAPEFKMASSVAAAFAPGLWKRLEARFAITITNQYGLTETVTSALYAGPHPEAGSPGTIGKPVDCEARVAPLNGASDEGELQLRGANIFTGYWRNPSRTAETFTDDGWMRTGDLARQQPDGSFEITGRLKTVIMTAGFLIRPEEIDEAMRRHPSVVASATVGIADETFDEVPMTVVMLDGPVDEPALTAHARQNLEPLKVPKRIISVPNIPLGAAGKPLLDQVKALIQAAITAQTNTPNLDAGAEAVLAVAADIFRVPISDLSLRSTPDMVAGWDSFTQISLILALEDRFNRRISAARAAAIRSLADALAAVSSSPT
jgi:acyl-CoA synthetase (AMP-forming)/AMP-acid ligase II/acyl carrier protein